MFPETVNRLSGHETIDENGYAILPGIFERGHLDRLLHELNELAPSRSRAGLRHALRFAPVAQLAREEKMIDLARAVLGPDAFPFRATLFDKSPAANWLVVWHQDTVLPLLVRADIPGWGPWSVKEGIHYAHAPAVTMARVLALRVHLDDSNSNNGPLRVLPGTHKLGLLSDDAVHKVATRTSPVECVAPKGAVVAMRPLLIHSSSKSHEEAPRRVLHIEYAASDSIAQPLQLAVA
jgi:ectoine hydroxylase-related dioxygenase (phytanoyl-CoA dioxygenase family)